MTNHAPIPLQIHPSTYEDGVFHAAQLDVGVDGDSSFIPSFWVYISLTDADHDSDEIRLTIYEAEQLHDRLGALLGRTGAEAA